MFQHRHKESPPGILAANVVRKALPEHVYGCKLMNGTIVYYRQEHPTEIRLERLGKISNLPPLPIRFAGELDSIVYFYTECAETQVYSFYTVRLDEFENIGEISTGKKLQFALQQPYFVDFTYEAITINKFGSGEEKTLSRETSGTVRGFESFSFFVWRNLAIIVREAEEGEYTSITDAVFYNGEICVVAIEHGLPPASSVYAQRGSLLYLLCGATLFVFNEDFSYHSFKMDRPECRIGGAETRRLFLNAKKLFFSHDLPEICSSLEKKESKDLEYQALRDTYNVLNSVKHNFGANIADFSSRFERDFRVDEIMGTGGDIKDKRGTRVVFGAVTIVKKEVFVMTDLEHPGIVECKIAWCEEPHAYWQYETDVLLLERVKPGLYELLAKSDLSKWLNSHQTSESRPLPKIKQFFKQMVSALDYLHGQKYIHRDLKPANVLIFDGDILKLCDMGIVIKNENGLEESHTGSGTRPYMSPEQNCIYSRLNFKTDIFSLGLILTELCIVMEGEEKYKIFDNFRRGVSNTLYGLDEETVSLVNRLTKRDPNDRPNCRQILEDPFLA